MIPQIAVTEISLAQSGEGKTYCRSELALFLQIDMFDGRAI
jgi:hypothetical protein